MKQDITNKIYNKVFDYELNDKNLNKHVKAVICDFSSVEIIVKNDNFGTKRKHLDFTEGKKEAGLHPLTIVFSGIGCAKIFHEKYINENDEVCEF